MALPLPHPYVVSHDGTLDAHAVQKNLDALALAQVSGIPRIVSGGKKNIPGAETTTSLAYTLLTTQDLVTVVLPTDGLIAVWYQALWQNTVASNGRAAVFIGANQLKIANTVGAPPVQEATGNNNANVDAVLSSSPSGLVGQNTATNMTEVTTGQMVAYGGAAGQGGPTSIFAAAGTYDVSIKFKNVAAGTLTASKRHLWVASYAFA